MLFIRSQPQRCFSARDWTNASEGIMGTHCSSLDEILEEDMHHWYTKFMRESPSGLITLFELKTMLAMNGMTEEASSYVDQVFYTFDMDGVKSSSGLLRGLLMLVLMPLMKLSSVMIVGGLVGEKKMYLHVQILTRLVILKSDLFMFPAGWLHRLCWVYCSNKFTIEGRN